MKNKEKIVDNVQNKEVNHNSSINENVEELDQLDGNVSVGIDNDYEYCITIYTGFRPTRAESDDCRVPVRRTIRRDNKGEIALYLPTIAVYNHRSIWKKL